MLSNIAAKSADAAICAFLRAAVSLSDFPDAHALSTPLPLTISEQGITNVSTGLFSILFEDPQLHNTKTFRAKMAWKSAACVTPEAQCR